MRGITAVLWGLFLLCGPIFSFAAWAVEPATVANVQQLQGKAFLIRGEKRLPLTHNALIQEGDRLETTSGSRVGIRLLDNTRIALAETTRFEVSRYRFNREAGSSDAKFRLLSGAFRAVTGAIGQQAHPRFEVETPVATMGIRGTDFWGGFIFTGDLDIAMFSGKGVYVVNEQGRVEIRAAGEGTTVRQQKSPDAVRFWPDEKLRRAAESTRLPNEQ